MRKKHLAVLAVLFVLAVGVIQAYAAPSKDAGGSIETGSSAWKPPIDEPMPCTNQRAKALYGCP